ARQRGPRPRPGSRSAAIPSAVAVHARERHQVDRGARSRDAAGHRHPVSIDRTRTPLQTSTTASEPVALCRIGVGIAALGRSLKDARDLYLLHHDPSVVPAPVFASSPAFATMPEIVVVGGLLVASSMALIVGYRAQLAAGTLTA